MGKKYMDTKKDTLEQSVLDVWQEAADMHAEDMDGRTKEYRSHRSQLETNRIRRENKRKSVKTEQPETQDGSDKRAYEMGTDRYAEYIHKLTPGQVDYREEVELDEGRMDGFLRLTFKSPADVKKAMKVSDTEFGYRHFIMDKARTRPELDIEGDSDDLQDLKDALKSAGIKFEIDLEEQLAKIKGNTPADEGRRGAVEDDIERAEKKGDKKLVKKLKEGTSNLTDTIKNLWIEAASSAVNPKDREDLDGDKGATGTGGKETAKKMKRAKEPAPGQMTEGSKEEYQKFFNAAMKKFKINSPADLKSDDEKKKFFDYVDKNYKGEKSEELLKSVEAHETWLDNKKIELTREFKVSSMRQALEKVWSVGAKEQQEKEDKKVKTKVEDHDDEDEKKKGDTMTGKKKASVDVNPHKGSY